MCGNEARAYRCDVASKHAAVFSSARAKEHARVAYYKLAKELAEETQKWRALGLMKAGWRVEVAASGVMKKSHQRLSA